MFRKQGEKRKDDSLGTQTNEEKVHTPASMFQMLHESLVADDKLRFIDDKYRPEIRHIVEIYGTIEKEPNNPSHGYVCWHHKYGHSTFSQTPSQQQHKGKDRKFRTQTKQLEPRWNSSWKSLKAGDTVDDITLRTR